MFGIPCFPWFVLPQCIFTGGKKGEGELFWKEENCYKISNTRNLNVHVARKFTCTIFSSLYSPVYGPKVWFARKKQNYHRRSDRLTGLHEEKKIFTGRFFHGPQVTARHGPADTLGQWKRPARWKFSWHRKNASIGETVMYSRTSWPLRWPFHWSGRLKWGAPGQPCVLTGRWRPLTFYLILFLST